MVWEEQLELSKNPNNKEIAKNASYINSCLQQFEDFLQNNNKTIFMVSREHTIADFYMFAIINDLQIFDIKWEKYKRVSIWYDFCR